MERGEQIKDGIGFRGVDLATECRPTSRRIAATPPQVPVSRLADLAQWSSARRRSVAVGIGSRHKGIRGADFIDCCSNLRRVPTDDANEACLCQIGGETDEGAKAGFRSCAGASLSDMALGAATASTRGLARTPNAG